MAGLDSLLGLLGIGGGGLLVGEAYDKLGDVGDSAMDRAGALSQDVYDKASFTGYGVTAPTGSHSIDAQGNYNLNLGADNQLMADQYRQMTRSIMNPSGALLPRIYGQLGNMEQTAQNMMTPSADMEQNYYDKIRAMQQPEEQRQRVALESRLAAQGQMGLNTGGMGQPQMFGLDKAIQEAQNQAAVQAIELARQQQDQQAKNYGLFANSAYTGMGTTADMANTYGQLQFMPQAAALDALQGANQAYSYADIGRRNASQLYGTGMLSGLDALLGSRIGQANLMGNIGSSLIGGGTGMLGQVIQQNGDLGLGDLLRDLGILS